MCSATPQSSWPPVVGRIVEDPEQLRRVGGQVLGEPFGGKAEPEGDAAHHRLGDPTHLVEPAQDDRSEVGRFGGEEVGAVQCDAGADPVVVGIVLGAEVDALLAVGAARRELAADREPSAPRPPGPRHRDRRLGVGRRARRTRAPSVRGRPAASGRRRARRSRRSRSRGHARSISVATDVIARVVPAGSSKGAMSTIGRSVEPTTGRWAPLFTTGSVRLRYGRVAQLVRALP